MVKWKIFRLDEYLFCPSFFSSSLFVEVYCFNPVYSSHYHIASVLLSHTEWIIYIEFVSHCFQKISSRGKKKIKKKNLVHLLREMKGCIRSTVIFSWSPQWPAQGWNSDKDKFLEHVREYLSRLPVQCFQTAPGFLWGPQAFCVKSTGSFKLDQCSVHKGFWN